MSLPPSQGPPQLGLHLPLTVGVARAGPIVSSNRPPCSRLSWPSGIFCQYSTLVEPEVVLASPEFALGPRKHTSPQESHHFSYSFEEHSSPWAFIRRHPLSINHRSGLKSHLQTGQVTLRSGEGETNAHLLKTRAHPRRAWALEVTTLGSNPSSDPSPART